jgi:hypothetical protein
LNLTEVTQALETTTLAKRGGWRERVWPKLLFETPLINPGRNRFVVTGDGQRFLVITRLEDTRAPINVALNWTAEMKK